LHLYFLAFIFKEISINIKIAHLTIYPTEPDIDLVLQ